MNHLFVEQFYNYLGLFICKNYGYKVITDRVYLQSTHAIIDCFC